MNTAKKISITLLVLTMLLVSGVSTVNAEVILSPGKYGLAEELVEASDYVFEGTLTGIHFEVVDYATEQPLDINDPPEGIDQLVYDSQMLYRLDTVYEISVSRVYKGEVGEKVNFYFDWGLREYKEDEQRQLLLDFGFRLERPDDWSPQYVWITSENYGSHINVGNNYLFFGRKDRAGMIRSVNYYFFAFGDDYPYYGSHRPRNFTDMFSYKILIDYLEENVIYGYGDLRGDIDGDREITITDYVMLKRIIVGVGRFGNRQIKAADINADGIIDATDVALMKRHILGIQKIENDPGSSEDNYIICKISGHDYSTEIVDVITHNLRDTQPRCLEEILEVKTCERCGYVTSEVISSHFIYCDK